MHIKIIDTTLREGRQSLLFDTIFTFQDEYIEKIMRMGVYDFEYRNPSVNPKEFENFLRLRRKFPKSNFHVHIFLNKENVKWVLGEVSIEKISTFIRFPMNDSSRSDLQALLKGTSKKIRVGVENAPAVSDKELEEFVSLIKDESVVDRVSFSDTLGTFTPETIHLFFDKVINLGINKDIEFHLHNDYGLVAANAVQLLHDARNFQGTLYLSTSFFGIGDRNGILSYGDLIANIIRLNISHSLDLKVYGEIIKLMETHKICFNRDPICATSYFHFASSHIMGEIGGGRVYHNISASELGIEPQFIFNEFTGPEVFKHISEKILHQKVSDNGLMLKEYVTDRMSGSKVQYMTLEEVTVLIGKFFEDSKNHD